MPGPSNLYGVANAPALAISFFSAAGSLVCPPGVATTIASTGPLIAPSAGYFFPMIWAEWPILFSATPPADLQMGFNINGGSTVDFQQTDTFTMIANTTVPYFNCLVGVPSNTAWRAPGSIINLTVNPLTNSVTYRSYSGKIVIALFRAPDQ